MYHKRGQITVFLILGVVLVFIVVAVILLSVTIQKTTLERKHQEIAQRLLQKEALRIYVDEELPDIIDDFLITFGKQGGKVYDDQGGSARRDIFIDPDNPPEVSSPPASIEYALAGEMLQIGYGIGYERDVVYNETHPEGNTYPCAPCLIENCGSGGDPPRFCEYRYPQRRGADGNIVRFGRLELPRLGEVERQLAGYLQKQLVGFIQEFIDQKVKLDVQVIPSSENPEIDVFFESERVRVSVKYPLILRYQGEDIAALADFSFTQETQFKKYYDAVRELFQYDVEYMDFQLTPDKIQEYRETKFPFKLQYHPNDNQPTYCQDLDGDGISTCELSLKYTFVPDMEMEEPVPVGADNVFVFRVPVGRIVRDRPYTFVVARQNRPPVVDYISNVPGKNFDYLVLPDAEEGVLSIPFNLTSARDPDEEEIRTFEVWGIRKQDGEEILYSLYQGANQFNYIPQESTPLKIIFPDENQMSDVQRIRICTTPVIPEHLYQEFGGPENEHPDLQLFWDYAPSRQSLAEVYCGCDDVPLGSSYYCSVGNNVFNGYCKSGGDQMVCSVLPRPQQP